MERRSFLHTLSHLSATPFLLSNSIFKDYLINIEALENTLEKGKILILIKLDGGNDGLNTLIPMDQFENLKKVRPKVVLPESKIIDLGGNDLGLHPELKAFKKLFSEGRFKIIQNVGYDNPNYSHFHSMDVWESASFSENKLGGQGNNVNNINSGWLGRYIEEIHPKYPYEYPNSNFPHPLSVEFGYNSSFLFTGNRSVTNSVTLDPQDFYKIFKDIQKEYPDTPEGNKLKFLQLITNHSNSYGEVLKEFYDRGSIKYPFSYSFLANQMEGVTKLITGGLNTRVYQISLSGFDTHSEQVDPNDTSKGIHSILLKQLNHSIEKLFQNLDETGDSDRVLVMTYSEFGRTVISSDSYGTDHGDVAPMFFFGNKIDSNILGSNPLIPSDADWTYSLNKEFNFQNIYFSVIKQWLGGEKYVAEKVLFQNLNQVSLIKKEYIDTDNDGVMDINDNCPDTPEGSVVDLNGCVLFTLASNNYSVKSVSASCIGSNNGKIEVSAEDTSYTYQVNISGLDSTYSLSADNNHSQVIEDLQVGAYTINFTIDSQEGYIQSFETTITEPAPLQGKAQLDYFSKTAKLKLMGSEGYYIEVNGQMMASNSNDFSAPLKPGKNIIKVTTPLDCQGVYEEVLFMSEKLRYFPNPVQNQLNITVPGTDSEINIEIFTDGGANLYRGTHSINGSRTIQLPMSRYKSGLYIVTGSGKTVNESFKIIKN